MAGLLASLCASSRAQDARAAYELSLVALDGKRTILDRLPGSVFAPRVSPDGKRVALEMRDAPRGSEPAGQERVWIADLERPKRWHALPPVGTSRNWAPLWSRDGRHIIFLVSGGMAADALWWRRADGDGEAERLVEGLSAEDVTPDGRALTYITLAGDRDYGISMIDLATKKASIVVDRPRSEQHSSTVSPDGRWIAYASNEAGRHDIWMEPLPGNGRRHRLTDGGGSHPVWAPDGKHLYFDRDGRIHALAIGFETSGPRAGEVRPLPIQGFQQGYRRRQFDLMPDGRQFLMLYPRGSRA